MGNRGKLQQILRAREQINETLRQRREDSQDSSPHLVLLPEGDSRDHSIPPQGLSDSVATNNNGGRTHD